MDTECKIQQSAALRPIAVSACLLGVPCRFDGKSKPCADVLALRRRFQLVPVCPEVAGGLSVPHSPCEIVCAESALHVVDVKGCDATDAFVHGARVTCERVAAQGCDVAILKSKSPSCGSGLIYDGTFTGTLTSGYGVAARMLIEAGVSVIDETQIGVYFRTVYSSVSTKGCSMLVASCSNASQHNYLSDRFRMAYEFLARHDLATLPLGRTDIDGDDVFANVQEYETVPVESKDMEAHRRYYDVQYVVSGEEMLQYAPLEGLSEAQPFNEADDFGLYCTPEMPSAVVLRAGDLAVLAPEDAHKPGCSLTCSVPVRKIVVKVRV